MTRFALSGVTIFLFLLHALPVNAAAVYTVSPLTIDTKVVARDIQEKTITITNTGSEPVTLYPTVNNISLDEGGTIQTFLPPVSSDRTRSLASWVELSRLGIDLKIGETKTIPFTLRIHPQPVPGVYHVFLGFGTGRNRDEAEAQVMAGHAPGVIVTATIEEKKVASLKLAGFVVDRFVTKKANTSASYTFKNPGSERLIPTGEIIYYDSKGMEVGTSIVNAEKISIAPGETHIFTATVPVDGLFGKYKAFLNVQYGSEQVASVQDTSYFYVFQLKNVLILMSVLLCIVGVLAWRAYEKYFNDDAIDDSERLTFRIRDSASEALHHDIDLKNKT